MSKMSPVTLFIRVLLILVLVGLLGCLYFEYSAKGAANKAFDKLQTLIQDRNVGPDAPPTTPEKVAELIGKQAASSEALGANFKREVFTWPGFRHDYHLEVTYTSVDTLQKLEDCALKVVSKLGF